MNGRERTRLAKSAGKRISGRGLQTQWGARPRLWIVVLAPEDTERRTRYSRYARVHLEMFTSANRLAAGGQASMKAICAPGNAATWTRVSPHNVCWDHVAVPNAAELAHAVFR